MNKNEIAKIKRRLIPDGKNPIEIRGWYINSKKAVISEISRSLVSLTMSDSEKYTQIFKRVLSGDVGKNLSILNFPMSEVMEGETHANLMRLTDSALTDEEALEKFMQSVADNLNLDGNNLILLMHDTYDTDFASHTDGDAIENESNTGVFKYLISAVCPVKLGKSSLSYDVHDNDFVTKDPDWEVTAPSVGFMFPCFEDGGANISNALFYSKDMGADNNDFVTNVLSANEVKPALEKKESFKAVLMDALEDECSYEVVQSMNEQLVDKLEEHKKDKESDPVHIGGREIASILTASGVSEERAHEFTEKFNQEFGAGTDLPLASIVEDKQYELKTGDITVKVSPKQAGQIETRVIDGIKYILIPADDGVTVNGISIGI